MDKKLYNSGFAVYGIFMVLAVVFYKERTILLDNSLFLFEMAKNGTFSIQRNRFIELLPELLPLLAIKLSVPLKGVLIIYSASFMLYHFVCYVLCGRVLKNYKLGIALLLTHTIILNHTFFWHLSELQTGISMLFPLLALVTGNKKKISPYLLFPFLFVSTVTVAFSHPLIIIPFFYGAIFLLMSKEVSMKWLFAGMSVLFILSIVVQRTYFSDAYEEKSMDYLTNFTTFFPNYLDLYANKRFFETLFDIYYWLPILWGVIIVVYALQRKWLKLVMVLVSVVVYSQIVNVSFYSDDIHDFYRENMYTVLSIFMALPFAYDLLPALKLQKTAVVIFFLICISSIFRVYTMRDTYRSRIDWFRGYMDKTGDEKVMVAMYDKPVQTILWPWATPYEFWLLSTVERNKTASIIIHEDLQQITWAWENYRAYVTTWGVFPYNELNPVYFKFRDASTHYSIYWRR